MRCLVWNAAARADQEKEQQQLSKPVKGQLSVGRRRSSRAESGRVASGVNWRVSSECFILVHACKNHVFKAAFATATVDARKWQRERERNSDGIWV